MTGSLVDEANNQPTHHDQVQNGAAVVDDEVDHKNEL
jgi:hypothetical protein